MQIKLKQYDDYQIVSKNLKLTIAQGVLLLFNVSMQHSFYAGHMNNTNRVGDEICLNIFV